MSKLAYIFPGQGSQSSGMGKELADSFTSASQVFEEADDALGFALSKVCFAGSDDDLRLTENTQPAILTVSIAALKVLQAEGFPQPDFVAGHSLGEYSALVAAGSISLADAVRTVRMRGRYMQEAVPVGVGAMAAVLGSDLDTILATCTEAAQGEVCSPANINAPGQIVIAGHVGAIQRAMDLLKQRGAKRVLLLPVSAPFHCELMQPAAVRLGPDLDSIGFRDLRVPLVANIDAEIVRTGERARSGLKQQVAGPVRWLQSVELLLQHGVDTFIEIGPGKVLSGLLRQIRRDARGLNVEDIASLRATQAAAVLNAALPPGSAVRIA